MSKTKSPALQHLQWQDPGPSFTILMREIDSSVHIDALSSMYIWRHYVESMYVNCISFSEKEREEIDKTNNTKNRNNNAR